MPPPPQSANGTVVVDGSSAVIIDAQGNAWRLTGLYGAGHRDHLDGGCAGRPQGHRYNHAYSSIQRLEQRVGC